MSFTVAISSILIFSLIVTIIGSNGLISIIFLLAISMEYVESPIVWALTILSIFAVIPYSLDTNTHGEFINLSLIVTFSIFLSKTFLINLHNFSLSFVASSNAFFSDSDVHICNPSFVTLINFLSL